MDFFLRKNGTVAGPMSQADFLARLANGEYAATDEMSTDGRVWTRLGITGFARSIQQGRVAAAPRLGSVVSDLTQPGAVQPGDPMAAGSRQKTVSDNPAGGANMVSAPPRHSGCLVRVIAVLLLLAACGAALWFLKGDSGGRRADARSPSTGETNPAAQSAADGATPSADGAAEQSPDAAAEPDALVVDPLSEEEKAAALADVPPLCRAALAAYLFPPPAEILGWFDMVRNSDYVLKNAEYRTKSANVWFRYHESTNEVNAYAAPVDKATDDIHANLNVFGGYVRFSRVVGAVMASGELAGKDAPSRIDLLMGPVAEADDFSPAGAVELLAKCGIAPEWFLNAAFLQEATNFANGMGFATAAHEMGHVACGHIWRIADISAESSRNKEREADSFSFSVSSEEREYALGAVSRYMFLGTVYELLAFSAQEAAVVKSLAERTGASTPEQLDALRARVMAGRTHPYSGARLLDLLRSKEDMARQYGLDPVALETVLRQIGIH